MDKNKFFKFCFSIEPSVFPDTAVITPFIPVKNFEKNSKRITSFKGRVYSGVILEKNKHRFAVIRSGMGASFAGDAVLFMKNTSIRRIIFAGACGGLGETRIGDIVLCDKAFDGETFSKYHLPDFSMKQVFDKGTFKSANREYLKLAETFLFAKLNEIGTVRTGTVFSIGSLLAETRQNLSEIDAQGFLGIDLELAAVYHAATASRIAAIGLIFVSDLPRTKPLWGNMTALDKKNYNNGLNNLVENAIELAVLKKA
ncbi:MAG: hypothetical protein ABIH85_06095 [Candidatus Omnitrophota bacterium]|nr:hypothetical protein [Candidatus Omnitrophota bacterium]